MARKRPAVPAPLPARARLLVPVLAATGGSGRSVTAGLLAAGLSVRGRTAVLDTAPRLASPWPRWSAQAGGGLAALPPNQPASREAALSAAAWCSGPSAASGFHVLTDHLSWSAAPLSLPREPAAWHQLAALGGWQCAVVDTTYPIAHHLVASQHRQRDPAGAAWAGVPGAVPVICAAGDGPGVDALLTAIQAADAAAWPLSRTVVVIVAIASGRYPAPVKAAITMLKPRVGDLVMVPHDPRIRSHGLERLSGLGRRAYDTADALARTLINRAQDAWGTPLPDAAVPAPLDAGVPSLEGAS